MLPETICQERFQSIQEAFGSNLLNLKSH